jgi:hypothetical protein
MKKRRQKPAVRDVLLAVLILLTVAGKFYFGGPYRTPLAARWKLGDDAMRIVESPDLIESYWFRSAQAVYGGIRFTSYLWL